jgi:inosose dehydratase
VRIGVNPLIWSNDDDPELGSHIPVERCLAEAREAGYAGIELGHAFPRDPRALRALLRRHGLSLVSGWWGARLLERGVEAELAELGPHVALLRAMSCTTLVFADVTGARHCDPEAPLSRRPVLGERDFARLARDLDALARRLAELGLRLAYHPHMGTSVQTRAEVARLLESTTDAVGLALDTGHFAWADGGGDAMAAFVSRWGRRIAHVHLKDVRRRVLADAIEGDAPFLRAVYDGIFTVPGDGFLDLDPVFDALRRSRYRGWIVVEAEQDPTRADPSTYAKLGFAHATRLVAGPGSALSRVPMRRVRRPASRRRPPRPSRSTWPRAEGRR